MTDFKGLLGSDAMTIEKMPIPTDNKQPSHFPTTPLDALIHLGAGRCSELDDYLALKPERLVLVEADPRLAAALKARVAEMPRVEVIEKTVSGQQGRRHFHRYNQADVSSLHAPGPALLAIFPGLRLLQEIEVDAVTPAALLEPMQLNQNHNNRLVIDLPGEELAVLKALEEAGHLHLFQQIKLQCGHDALYEEGVTASKILEWLKDHGYDLLAQDDGRDPDRPGWYFKRNKLQIEVQDLREQLVIPIKCGMNSRSWRLIGKPS